MRKVLVHTIANARKNEIKVLSENIIKIKVTAPPIDGQANDEIIRLLAKHFKVHKTQIAIIKGIASDKKIIEIA